MNAPQTIIISAEIIAAAILVRENMPVRGAHASQNSMGRYVAISTDAVIRVNVIDTHTGAVRHCWTEDYQGHTARCSRWVGGQHAPASR
jgi:hypothetical protein